MQLLAVIIAALLIIGPILGISSYFRSKSLEERVRNLERALKHGRVPRRSTQDVAPHDEKVVPTEVSVPTNESDVVHPDVAEIPSDAAVSREVQQPKLSDLQSGREYQDKKTPTPDQASRLLELIRENWMVVLGGVCLVLAGIFLVRYSIEHGLLNPTARITLGMLFGGSLLAAGEYLRVTGRHEAKVHAVLVASGSLVIYSSLLVGHSIYSLFSANFTFIAMAMMSTVTMLLALKHGPMMAGMGILGAYLVPILVDTGSNNIEAALLYSLVVTSASFWLQRYVYRKWLWWGTWAGAGLWLLISLSVPDQAQGLRALYITALAYISIALGFAGLRLSAIDFKVHDNRAALSDIYLVFIGMSVALLVSLVAETRNELSYPVAALYPLMTALIVRQNLPGLKWLPLISLLPFLFEVFSADFTITDWVLTMRPVVDDLSNTYAGMLVMISLGYAGLGFRELRAGRHTVIWAALALFVPLVAIILAYLRVSGMQEGLRWGVLTAVLALFYLFLLQQWRKQANDDVVESVLAFSVQAALGVASFLAFSDISLTLVLAVQLVGLAWLYQRYQAGYLIVLIKIMVSIVIVRLTLNPWIMLYDVDHLMILLTYVGCLAACLMAARETRGNETLQRWLYSASAHLLVLAVAVCTRYMLYQGDIFAHEFSFTEVVIYANGWAAIGLIYDHRCRQMDIRSGWYSGLAMLHLLGAAFAYVFFLVLIFNPLWYTHSFSSTPVFNLLLPAYGLPLLLLFRANRQLPELKFVTGCILLVGYLLFITLEIRHLWHGAVRPGLPVDDGELYTYSLAWLLSAIAIMFYGNARQNALVSKAGMGVLLLVIAKVFFWDMAGLDGLWRVLSFLGLGMCLLAVAYFFNRLKPSTHSSELS